MKTLRKLDALGAVLRLLERVADPRERARAIVLVRAELHEHDDRLRDLLLSTVHELRALESPATWREIGELLNVSPQRAFELAGEKQ